MSKLKIYKTFTIYIYIGDLIKKKAPLSYFFNFIHAIFYTNTWDTRTKTQAQAESGMQTWNEPSLLPMIMMGTTANAIETHVMSYKVPTIKARY